MNNTNFTLPYEYLNLVHSIFYSVTGIFGTICNLIVIFLISRYKPLQKPCFRLIAGSSFGGLVMSIGCIITAYMKLSIFLRGAAVAAPQSGFVCFLEFGAASTFGVPFNAQVACLVGLDRLISLMAPIRYHKFGRSYVVYMLCFSALTVSVQEVIGISVSPLDKTYICASFGEVMHPMFYFIYGALNTFYCTLHVVIYAAMIGCFRYTIAKSRSDSSEQANLMKHQAAIMPTVKLLMLLYVIFGVCAEVSINVGLRFERSSINFLVLNTTGVYLKYLGVFVEIVSLSMTCKRFRQAFRKLLCRKTNAVSNTGL